MTKKEFIESMSGLPDDAEMVFATGAHLMGCVSLNPLNISVVSESVNMPQMGGVIFHPIHKTAIVLDAIPYWYLKERYGITLNDHTESGD